MDNTTPQDRAIAALNEKFDCANGTISLEPPELRHLTATKATGPGLFDWQKLTLGEIVDCLADAGLLADPAKAEALTAVAESAHPGEFLREELQARGLTQLAFAEMVGRSVALINRIIKGKKSITANTALDLERGLGVSAGFWVRLQAEHDLAVARQRRAWRAS